MNVTFTGREGNFVRHLELSVPPTQLPQTAVYQPQNKPKLYRELHSKKQSYDRRLVLSVVKLAEIAFLSAMSSQSARVVCAPLTITNFQVNGGIYNPHNVVSFILLLLKRVEVQIKSTLQLVQLKSTTAVTISKLTRRHLVTEENKNPYRL